MNMPVQKPGKSKQDYGTPRELLCAIEKRYGVLTIDLAARADNAKASRYITPEMNSLDANWHVWINGGIGWLNPPFANIRPWTEKCASTPERVIMLVPASIGSEWFAKYVEGIASVVGLRPRITFEGAKDPYPKDCMLCLYNFGDPTFETWRWK